MAGWGEKRLVSLALTQDIKSSAATQDSTGLRLPDSEGLRDFSVAGGGEGGT